MKRILPAFFGMVIFLICATAYRSLACTCFSPPPCEALQRADCVFIGELAKEQDPTLTQESLERSYTFKVSKVYKGSCSDEIQVTSGVGGGDCGYTFDREKLYLIYAYTNRNGALYTDICTRTRPLSEASLDLSYLDNLPESARQTHVWGMTMEFDSLTSDYIQFRPRPWVQVSTTSNGRQVQTVSDSLGNFHFVDLPPDSYDFHIAVPPHLVLEYGDAYTKVRLTTAGCAIVPLYLVPNGQISGRVLDTVGGPVARIDVDLVPKDSLYAENAYLGILRGYTNQSGRYTIEKVPPGRYLIGVNLKHEPRGRQPFPSTFHPGVLEKDQARIVEIGPGEQKESVDIRMPKQYDIRRIRGILRYSDGRPVRSGYVTFTDARTESVHGRQLAESGVDSSGNFSLPVLPWQKGWVHASAYADTTLRGFSVTNPDPVQVEASTIASPLALTVRVTPKQ